MDGVKKWCLGGKKRDLGVMSGVYLFMFGVLNQGWQVRGCFFLYLL